MAISRLARDKAWGDLITIEEKLFEVMAIYSLSEEGINSPSKDEINEKISYLTHNSIRPTVLIARRLTPNELKCLYYASCGKEVKEIANLLKKTESLIIKIRASACHKLRCAKTSQAIFVATQPTRHGEHKVRSQGARDRRALTGEAGNASRRQVIVGATARSPEWASAWRTQDESGPIILVT